MVDNSPSKLMHKIFRDALCIHVSVDGYLWLGFNIVELSTVATLLAPYGGIWQVGLKKADNNIWFGNGALQKDAYLYIDMRVGDMTKQGLIVRSY